MLNNFCFHVYTQKTLIIGENDNDFFLPQPHPRRCEDLFPLSNSYYLKLSSASNLTSCNSSGSDISSDEDTGGPNMEPQPGSEVEWGLVKTGKSVQGKND